ncbi:MAG: transposase [Cyclobacteriaceae bacterium]
MTDWLDGDRKSKMKLNEVYFWTDTIKDWSHLLADDAYKLLIINQLKSQVEKGQIKVFGYVIMPNHIYLLWQMIQLNGKEMPHASFNKATAHEIINDLKSGYPDKLSGFRVDEKERKFRVWLRDPLAVLMDSKEKFEQKLDYIHDNPLVEKWSFVKYPEEYKWSSAKFYLTGEDEFGFLTHYSKYFE